MLNVQRCGYGNSFQTKKNYGTKNTTPVANSQPIRTNACKDSVTFTNREAAIEEVLGMVKANVPKRVNLSLTEISGILDDFRRLAIIHGFNLIDGGGGKQTRLVAGPPIGTPLMHPSDGQIEIGWRQGDYVDTMGRTFRDAKIIEVTRPSGFTIGDGLNRTTFVHDANSGRPLHWRFETTSFGLPGEPSVRELEETFYHPETGIAMETHKKVGNKPTDVYKRDPRGAIIYPWMKLDQDGCIIWE
ncbi:MAG: hypothetical protein PHC64_02910 [Candidatus Gastranaerophilales bacterium]|nr:hypothetical protein [Candidatus Gastranaerophilales bacterium]